jgi:hypothetical protein
LSRDQLNRAANKGRRIKYMENGECDEGIWDRAQGIFIGGITKGEATTVWKGATVNNIRNQVLSQPC